MALHDLLAAERPRTTRRLETVHGRHDQKNGSTCLGLFLNFGEDAGGVRGCPGERSEAAPRRTAPQRPGRCLLCSCSETTQGHRACLSPARGIRLGLLEGMDRRCGHTFAIRDVLLVLYCVPAL